ncbi:MAG: RNA-directed DNA polymerase [Planctomycetes bacterium]|nr:RNA-directed DNA polymerase [Planctomycetota bacterium]
MRNIACFGDTDIFTFALENSVFHDMEGECAKALEDAEPDIGAMLVEEPPYYANELSIVGYSGFRQATCLDPFWNALFLSSVLAIADKVENSRLPKDRVFAYRYAPTDGGALFETDSWNRYRSACEASAATAPYVLVCDIADFYGRVYHHRVDNALAQAAPNCHHVNNIINMLLRMRGGASYGLPVGGAASRVLAELALDRCDRLLDQKGLRFFRYVDDYTFFIDSRDDAYSALHYLSSILAEMDGLALQKAKTRVVTGKEYLGHLAVDKLDAESDALDKQERDFLMIRWRYDPYSQNAEIEYQQLREAVGKYDIVGMLGREVRKSRLNPQLAKKLMQAVEVLEGEQLRAAIQSIIASMESLYPVIAQVLLLMKRIVDGGKDAAACMAVFDAVASLVKTRGRLVLSAPVRGFAVRVLARDMRDDATRLLVRLYDSEASQTVKRDIVYAMIFRGNVPWLSQVLKRWASLGLWEKRAMVAASYLLGDEGDHWRKKHSKSWDRMSDLVAKWAAARKGKGQAGIPL